MISGTASITAAMYGQLQEQSLRRSADQAQLQANALQQRAASARREADQARENARELEVASVQAQGKAENAKRGVAMLDQSGQGGELRQRLINLANTAVTATTSSVASATNAIASDAGTPAIGSLIDVTA